MHYPYCRLLLTLALTLPAIGCAGKLRLAKTAAPTAIHPKTPFAEYLQANRFGRWVYQRTEVQPASDRPPIHYPRHITVGRLQEGIHERQQLLPLNRYLQPSDQPSAYPLGRSRWGIFFDLLEPMDPLPLELESGRLISSSTTIRYYDQSGRRIDVGRLTREAQIVGLETVECPAGTFKNCLRIRVDLLIHFRWGPHVDWKGTVWLSPQVGEVKRVQSMSGCTGSSFSAALMNTASPPTNPCPPPLEPPPRAKPGLAPVPSVTGMHLAARFRFGGVGLETEVAERARGAQVGFDRLSVYCAATRRQAGIVLGYGGISDASIAEGLRRLRDCVAAAARQRSE
jgi:hypothetical protein